MVLGQLGEHLGHLFVVVDVEGGNGDVDVGVPLGELRLELVEAVDATGAQRQVAALGGEFAGHACAETGAGTRDQDLLPSHPDSVGMMGR